jgi:hypothetical protein
MLRTAPRASARSVGAVAPGEDLLPASACEDAVEAMPKDVAAASASHADR